MSTILCLYCDASPEFPASDQHPDAVRYGPRVIAGITVFVDALDGEPTDDDIRAALNPAGDPVESRDVARLVSDKLGCSLSELRDALAAAARP